jgi:chaperonin GroES
MPRSIIDEDVDVEKLQPTQDHILIKVLDREKTSGGILLPGNAATPCRVGKVIARGKEIPNNKTGKGFPIQCEPGDYVLFMDYAGERLRVAWKDYRLIRENGLWAKVKLGVSDLIDFEEVQPWAERIVVERADETYARGTKILLPNKEQATAYAVGTVKTVGWGVWHLESGTLLPCETKPGDQVIYRRYSGAEIMIRGRELRIVQEVDVMAVME